MILDRLKALKDAYNIARDPDKNIRAGINTLLEIKKNAQTFGDTDFFDLHDQSTILSQFEQVDGLADNVRSPRDLHRMVFRDTYYSGLFDSIEKKVLKNGFYIEIAKDEDGELLGSKEKAQFYEDELKRLDYMKLVSKQIYGEYGDGGGNVLLFTTKTNKGLEFRAEPFLEDGMARVRVFGDNRLKVVTKYQVVSSKSEDPVFILDPNKNAMMHVRFSDGGNYRFSSNPAKKAVFWYILKNNIAGANNAAFRNGLQEPTIQTPDYQAMASLISAVKGENDSIVGDSNDMIRDPLGFIEDRERLDTEILRDLVGRPERSHSLIKFKTPYKHETIGRNNQSMQTVPMINLCNDEMGHALRTSMGIINTKNSKYSNAEIERDNWEDLVIDGIKTKVETTTEDFYLPVIDPEFDREIYRVRFGRDPNQESVDIYKAKTERNSAVADIMIKVATIPGVEYDLENDEIIRTQEDEEGITEPKGESEDENKSLDLTNDEIVEDNGTVRKQRVKKKLTNMVNRALTGPEARKFEGIIQKAFERQLETYTKRLSKHKTLEEALSSLEKDLPTISASGLNVQTMKQQLSKFAAFGVEEFDSNPDTQEKERQQRAETVIPKEVRDLMDAKAQLMIKGWDSLNPAQKNSILEVFDVDYQTYSGLDQTTSEKINKLISDAIASEPVDTGKTFINDQGIEEPVLEVPGVEDIVKQLQDEIAEISKNQAQKIAQTEISQGLEGTRKKMYDDFFKDEGEKKWFNVGDFKVRDEHISNTRDGWIPIKSTFSNGATSPASEINCRCTVAYRRKRR